MQIDRSERQVFGSVPNLIMRNFVSFFFPSGYRSALSFLGILALTETLMYGIFLKKKNL